MMTGDIGKIRSYSGRLAGVLAGLFLLLVSFVNLGSVPAVWWDEGWTLLVAKNWVERGFYGRLLEGQLAPPGLQAAFPVIAPMAASFRLFGVGIWQGRLPGVLFTLASLALLFFLSKRLYSRPIAWGAVFVVVGMLVHPAVNPIYNGRMVLADMPVVFYLLAGYACLLAAFQKPIWFVPLTALFWGIALDTKIQTLPFWSIALIIPLGIAVLRRNWRSGGLLFVSGASSLVASRLVVFIQGSILKGHTLPQQVLVDTWETQIAVLNLHIRLDALATGLLYGLPTLLGLALASWQLIKRLKKLNMDDPAQVVWVSILWLAGSWIGWFFLLSNGGARYLATPCFLGGMFVSALLSDVTGGFNMRWTWQQARNVFRRGGRSRVNLATLFTVVISILYVTATLLFFDVIWLGADHSAEEVSKFLNTQAPPGSMVETYESELFFFLQQPYHFPPDQAHIEYLHHELLDPTWPVVYDPLVADPDYLVVGPIGKNWHVYDKVVAEGDFKLIHAYPRYDLYARVRKK